MSVLRLFPEPAERLALEGLYLGLNLHRQAEVGDVLIYSNFIASLDGRISLHNADTQDYEVPAAIANKRDWRLYQELAAQSDVMITSARYFRQLAAGRAQDLLPVGEGPGFDDLAVWRQQQGMKPQPDVAIISRSLDIPLQAIESLDGRRILIVCSEDADPGRVHELQAAGAKVLFAGKKSVEGGLLRQRLIEAGYRSAYMIAGPEVHRTLLSASAIDRLFLTTHMSLLGGSDFHTLLEAALPETVRPALQSLYYDSGEGQFFSQYSL